MVVLFINLFCQLGFMKDIAAMHLTFLFHSACTHGVLLLIMAFLSCLAMVLVYLFPPVSCFLFCHGDPIIITVIERQLQRSLQLIQGDY